MEAAPAPRAPAAPAEAHTPNIAPWRGASWTLAATGGWPQGWGTGLTCPRWLGGHDQEGLWVYGAVAMGTVNPKGPPLWSRCSGPSIPALE